MSKTNETMILAKKLVNRLKKTNNSKKTFWQYLNSQHSIIVFLIMTGLLFLLITFLIIILSSIASASLNITVTNDSIAVVACNYSKIVPFIANFNYYYSDYECVINVTNTTNATFYIYNATPICNVSCPECPTCSAICPNITLTPSCSYNISVATELGNYTNILMNYSKDCQSKTKDVFNESCYNYFYYQEKSAYCEEELLEIKNSNSNMTYETSYLKQELENREQTILGNRYIITSLLILLCIIALYIWGWPLMRDARSKIG